jgi:hypothetical protein
MPEQTSLEITCTAVSYDNLLNFAEGNLTASQESAYTNYLRSLFMVNNLLPVGAEDDCNDTEIVETYIAVDTEVSCPAKAIVSCVFVAIDACGNTSEEEITQLIVVDETTPHIFCPSDITVACDSDASPEMTGYATSTDNCTGPIDVSYTDSPSADTDFCPTSFIRLWTAVDECGNTATCEQFITLVEEVEDCSAAPSGLHAEVQGSNSVLFTWNPVPGSIGCRVFGRLAGMNSSLTVGTVTGSEPTSLFVQNNQLKNGREIEWRVICACSINPLEATPFSLWDSFVFYYDDDKSISTAGKEDEADGNADARLLNGTVYPNPTKNQVWLEAQMSEGDLIIVRDLSGQVIASYIAPSESGLYEVNMSKLSAGVYFLQHTDAEGNFQVHKVIKTN